MIKEVRQNAILDLISQYNIDRQQILLEKLHSIGIEATQATVSRDIRELGLVKKTGKDGKYYYARPADTVSAKNGILYESDHFKSIFLASVVHVDYAGNIVLIKCYSGMANAACEVFDSLHWKNVVGTLSGDDTFFVLVRSESDAKEICIRLKDLIQKV